MYTSPVSAAQALRAVSKKVSVNVSRLSAAPDPLEFTPRHFQFPGCTFQTHALLEFRAAPRAFCWPMTNRGPIDITVPITDRADFAVVSVNGSFPSKGNTYGLDVGEDAKHDANHANSFTVLVKKDTGEATNFNSQYGDEVGNHFNENLVVQLDGAKSLSIEIQSTSPTSYTFISSVQVHYVNSI